MTPTYNHLTITVKAYNHLTIKGEEALTFANAEDAKAAFEASGLDRDNIGYTWDSLITKRVSVYGPFGGWFGYLCEPQLIEDWNDAQ